MTAAAFARTGDGDTLVAGDFPLTQAAFLKIASMLREQSGISLPEAKAALVYSRLAKRVRILKLSGFDEYCRFVGSPQGEGERTLMLAALTTNVTRFFREPHHFEHLTAFAERELVRTARAGGKVRIWSSACSSGEEAYSIALSLLAVLPEAGELDVKVLASDIDPLIVAKAREGVYSREALQPVPAQLRERYFTRVSGADLRMRVADEVRALVRFKELNLIGAWPMRGKFDAIFCRNVVIYFEEDTQNQIWTRFADLMAPHARLYVGHSERVDNPRYLSDGLTVYRLARTAA